ncbi:MAG: ATP-binding protein [Gemmatimonadetes bacterium]|nr:ATP-binding protein [Gemmatimonadota bacterium]
MSNILYRQELGDLERWFAQRPRKPLVVRGARQVGKSTLVREFALRKGAPLVTIDFERNPEVRDAFRTREPARILSTLSLLTGQTVTPGKDLLFLDEIQAAPEALAALRYFHEELPELPVVAAGSLMEFALADAQFSMPVGRVEYLHLGPLRFEDFVEALGHPELKAHLRNLPLDDLEGAFPEAVHDRYMDLLRQYWVVGGLPEAVSGYVQAQRESESGFERVARVQHSVVATYRDDFSKYSHGTARDRLQLTFDRLPGLVGRKFKYVQVSRDHRAADLADALQRLCMAQIAYKVCHTAANGVPLEAEMNDRHFKCLYLDVGLMCAALGLNVLDLSRQDLTLVNAGAVAEQFIGQHLLHSGPSFQTPSLHYWTREARNAAAEVDYLMALGGRIVPVEIKAGTSGSLKSLHQFLKEKGDGLALRFNADPPSLLSDAKRLPTGELVSYRLLSLPLYLVDQARWLLRDEALV